MPIRIYLFKCNHCGLLYFGKTESRNWKTYKGSGKYWKVHLRKHKATITKKWIGYFINKETAKIFCLWYSRIKDIVKSNLYANLIEENGLDGNCIGNIPWNKGLKGVQKYKPHTKEFKLMISRVHKGKILSEETKNKMKKPKSKDTKLKLSISAKNRKKGKCIYCYKVCDLSNLSRWHNENCKYKSY